MASMSTTVTVKADSGKSLDSPLLSTSTSTLANPTSIKLVTTFPSADSLSKTNAVEYEASHQTLVSGPTEKKFRGPTEASAIPGPPPDGGILAWMQCLGSFFLFFNCWGIVNTFGTFQTFYETNLLPTSTSSAISWIGSLQAFLLMFGGFLTAPLFDRGHLRLLLSSGTILVVSGMMLTSICAEYWQFLLAQGFCVGLGCGCLFVPSVAILPTYFARHKALALGIGAAGSSIGGIVYPVIFHTLQPQIGFGWTTRLLGFVILATLAVPFACMRIRYSPPKSRAYFDIDPWLDISYTLYMLGVFFAFAGLYVPFFYFELYAIKNNLVDPELGFYLLAIMNAGSFFGRIIPNALADRIGPMNVLIVCGFASTISGFSMSSVRSESAVLAYSVLYGFFSGPFVSLPPAVIVNLSPNPNTIGVRLGMLFVSIAVGLLVGNPAGGAILARGYEWIGLSSFCGALVLLGASFVFGARVTSYGWRVMVKG